MEIMFAAVLTILAGELLLAGGAAAVFLIEALRVLREISRRRPEEAGETGPEQGGAAGAAEERHREAEDPLRNASMQEGFANLMRYSAATAQGRDGPVC